MSLQVIGVGLSRTGTLSMHAALELLYPGKKCYHGKELFLSNGGDLDAWLSHMSLTVGGSKSTVARRTPYTEASGKMDWDKFLTERGFVAGVDIPFALCLDELMAKYPKAKVLLTVRDSPEAWSKSFIQLNQSLVETIMTPLAARLHKFRVLQALSPFMTKALGSWPEVFKPDPVTYQTTIRRLYTEYNDRIIAKVPPSRLLVFNVKSGWKPLCEFLEVAQPAVPFPHLNEGTMTWKMRALMFREAVLTVTGSGLVRTLLVLLIAYWLFRVLGILG